MTRGGYESDCLRLRVCDLATTEQHFISEEIDLSFACVAWVSNTTLLCNAQFRGRLQLVLVDLTDVNSPQLRYLPGGGSRTNEAIHKNEVLFLESSLSTPAVIRSAPLASFVPFHPEPLAVGDAPKFETPLEVRTLVDVNPKYSEGAVSVFSECHEFYFAGAHGHPIHAWYLAPPGLAADAPAKSVPLLLIVHGGPQGAFLDTWHYR
jgi:dipeptidyl aminopeptidase/acylaminoacyl peptidase